MTDEREICHHYLTAAPLQSESTSSSSELQAADRHVVQRAGIPAGFYLKGPGMVAPCPKGEYKVGQGAAAACTKCAKGVTTAAEASGTIDACNGEWCDWPHMPPMSGLSPCRSLLYHPA